MGVRTYYKSFKEATQYPHLFRFLITWFLYSDGLSTIGIAAVLFATNELDFTSADSALLIVEVMLFGAAGGVLFLWLQRKLEWSAKRMVCLHLTFFICMSLYCVVGIIPNSPIGLVSKTEMYIFAIFYGLNFGSVLSFSRAVFASIVPIGKEAQMFALYEVTDKGSSWIGPLTSGLIANYVSLRYIMLYIAMFFIIPLPILIRGVDVQQGMRQAGRYKEAEEPMVSDTEMATTNEPQAIQATEQVDP